MSLMQAQRQGEEYPKSTLLKSSNKLGWSTLFADLRSHSRGEGPSWGDRQRRRVLLDEMELTIRKRNTMRPFQSYPHAITAE
jgi:hypothetical protein